MSSGNKSLIIDTGPRIDLVSKEIRVTKDGVFEPIPIEIIDISKNMFSVSPLGLSDEMVVLSSQILLAEDTRRMNTCECYEQGGAPYQACLFATSDFEDQSRIMALIPTVELYQCHIENLVSARYFDFSGIPNSEFLGNTCEHERVPEVTGFERVYSEMPRNNKVNRDCLFKVD